jgi:uncharacterized protein YjbI with pentapeptide repeats
MNSEEEQQARFELRRLKLEAEIENLKASRRKATAEAKKAEHEVEEVRRQRGFLERILSTTQATVGFALITLICQIVQFAYTARQGVKADESKQWKDAVMSISYKGDDTSVGSALTVATFFDSPAYGGEARKLVGGILPHIQDDDSFKGILDALLAQSSSDDEVGAYDAAITISDQYRGIAERVHAGDGTRVDLASLCDDDLSDVLQRDPFDLDEKDAHQADVRDDQIDIVTRSLAIDMKKRGKPPQAAKLARVFLRFGPENAVVNSGNLIDLSGLDFTRVNLKQAYLCKVNFAKAKLQGATLDGAEMKYANLEGTILSDATIGKADLGAVANFAGSRWDGVRWWEASQISAPLCSWLTAPASHAPALPAGSANPCSKRE